MIVVGIGARGHRVQVLHVGSRDRAGPLLITHSTVTALHPYISLTQSISWSPSVSMLMMPVEVVGVRGVPTSTVDPSAGGALLERG